MPTWPTDKPFPRPVPDRMVAIRCGRCHAGWNRPGAVPALVFVQWRYDERAEREKPYLVFYNRNPFPGVNGHRVTWTQMVDGESDGLARRGLDYVASANAIASKKSTVELRCRECQHPHHAKRRDLFQLAEDAEATGRRTTYL